MSTRVMGWVSNLLEPKRTNRYELLLEDELRLTCKSVSLPQVSVEQVDIHRMHNKFKVAGSKVNYAEMSLTFYDFVDNKSARKLDEWFKQVYDIGTSKMGYPGQYKKDLTLIMYGPDASIVETWNLIGAWPKDLKKTDLSWENANPVEVSLTLVIDEFSQVFSA